MNHSQTGFVYFRKVLLIAPYSTQLYMFAYVHCFKHPLWDFWWSLWRRMQEQQPQWIFQSFWLGHHRYFCRPLTSASPEPALGKSRGTPGKTGSDEQGNVWSSLGTGPKTCSTSAETSPGLPPTVSTGTLTIVPPLHFPCLVWPMRRSRETYMSYCWQTFSVGELAGGGSDFAFDLCLSPYTQ